MEVKRKYSYQYLFCLHVLLLLIQPLLVRSKAENKTVLVGTNATFLCNIENLDEKQIHWSWTPEVTLVRITFAAKDRLPNFGFFVRIRIHQ